MPPLELDLTKNRSFEETTMKSTGKFRAVLTLATLGGSWVSPAQAQVLATNPAALIGEWGTSSTPTYGSSYGLSYTFNRDGTYMMHTSMGTSMQGSYTVNGSQITITSIKPPRPPQTWAWGIGDNGYGKVVLRLMTANGPQELYRR